MFDRASIKTVLQLKKVAKKSTPCTLFFLVNFNYVNYYGCGAYSRIICLKFYF